MIRYLTIIIFFTAQTIVFAPLCIIAQISSSKVDSSTNKEKISTQLLVLKDSLSQLDFPEVINPSYESKFLAEDAMQFDTKSQTYWLRLSIQGTQQTPEYWTVKMPHADTAELFLPFHGGNKHFISGDDIPFDKRAVQYGEFVCFSIPVSDTITTVYLRLTSTSRYSLGFRNLKDIRFISPASFTSLSHSARYFHGIFLGVTLAMIIFNFIIYVMFRDKTYLVYSGFMITQTLYHLAVTGFLLEFVFYNSPQLDKYSSFIIAGVSLIWYILFSQVYLETKKFTPKLNSIYQWLYPIICIDVFTGYFFTISFANSALLIIGLFVITFPFCMSIIAYRKHYRPAIYFLIASVLSYLAYFIYVPMGLKLIPEVFLTRYSLQITFALQSLLFAMGLADRINLIRKELELKKLEKERLEKEQEIAMNTLLEKQNEELELKVKERTVELEEKNREVELDREIILHEREKSDALLLNILPEKIAHRLKSGEEMIAERFDNVTVFFSDIVGFTKLSKRISPEHLVGKLNSIFIEFDKLALHFGLEKIKTIGDAYMCVCGLPEPCDDHARRVALFALGVQKVMQEHVSFLFDEETSVRIGIHSGTVIAGVIGKQKFAYDLWGETVNTASRLESHGEPFKIHCSPVTYSFISEQFEFECCGETELKGIGLMTTYFLLGEKAHSKAAEVSY